VRKLNEEKIEKIKKAEEIFEEAYQKGFFGAIELNKSQVKRDVEWPGTLGNFLKDVWGRWLKRKAKELAKQNQEQIVSKEEEGCNG
jgi:hypothetical protein